jgi:AcrR family transcriptional regulator
VRTKTPELDQRILDTAARLFAGAHFHQVRMEDIAAEADVGKGTLYRYFRDKDELYLALLSRAANQLHDRLDDILSLDLDPEAKLTAMVESILEFFSQQPHIFELIQQAEASRGTNHPWQAARTAVVDSVLSVFTEAKRRKLFAIPDPHTTALVLLGGVRAVIRFGRKPHAPDLAHQIVHTVLKGAIADRRETD